MDEPTPFRVEFFRDLLKAPPPKHWLIRDVFGMRDLSVVYGAPGDGKSVLIGDAACHVAAGLPWFGKQVTQCGVLYVAAERAALVKRRMAGWASRYDQVDIPLAVLDAPINFVESGKDAARLAETATSSEFDKAWSHEVGWIIIDTKARTMGAGDENAAKDMNSYVERCAFLQRNTGCHVTIIDHVPQHDKTRIRGHGSLLGAADSTFRVSKEGGVRLFEVDKVNDGPDDVRFSFTLDSETVMVDEDGQDVTAPIVVPGDVEAIVRPAPGRRLNDRQKLAMDALAEALLCHGKPAPPAFQLQGSIRVTPVDAWRDEMLRRGVIDRAGKNPRADFSRLRDGLAARHLIGVREDLVWRS